MNPKERLDHALVLAGQLLEEIQQVVLGLKQAVGANETARDPLIMSFEHDLERIERASAAWTRGGQIDGKEWRTVAATLLLDDARRGLPTDFEERSPEERKRLAVECGDHIRRTLFSGGAPLLGVGVDAWITAVSEWCGANMKNSRKRRSHVLGQLLRGT